MPDQAQNTDSMTTTEVTTLLRQQTAFARFGELALRCEDLDEILMESCRLVGQALGTGLTTVLELQPDGRTLLVRAGVGWTPGMVGSTQFEADERSPQGHALRNSKPVISTDVTQEKRFIMPDFLHENRVRAMVDVVIIGSLDRPHYGVLEVGSRLPRSFDDSAILFLKTYANLLAAAVDRLQTLQETRRAAGFIQTTSKALNERRMLDPSCDVTDLGWAETVLREENVALGQQVDDRTKERDRIWQLSHDMLGVSDTHGIWLSVNPAWTTVLGRAETDILGRTSGWLWHPEDQSASREAQKDLEANIPLHGFQNRLRARDGSYRVIYWTAIPYENRIYAVGRDVTAEREQTSALLKAEEALRQSQKMEAIGQLTGGVAHDFNNLLTVIRSSVDLLKRPNLAEARRARYITAIADTVERAARLTGQLLAFARRQALQPRIFAACDSVRMLCDMLGTLTGSRVEVVTELPEHRCFVNADPNQFDTALVNMAVNARDAMNGEGRLTIKVRTVEQLPAVRLHSAVPGPYVAVSLTDTGSGIPPDQLDRIFEPFFTTKEPGKGTGLGLSQVIGFAKQSGGEVIVESRLGEGTTFTIFLLQVAEQEQPAKAEEIQPLMDGHGTRVLVVEDKALLH